LTKEFATKEKLEIVLSAPIQGETGGRGVKAMLKPNGVLAMCIQVLEIGVGPVRWSVGDFVGQAATKCFFSQLTGDCEKWCIFVRIFRMAIKNYLVEGVSGSGKTSVCDELINR
jgi:hypothetical protein